MSIVDANGHLHDPSGRYGHRVRAMPMPLAARRILDASDEFDQVVGGGFPVVPPPRVAAVAAAADVAHDAVNDPAPF